MALNPAWVVRTARLNLTPVEWSDLPDLRALKGDPRVYAVMLGGVRTPVQVAEELAQDIAFWAAQRCGIWSVRMAGTFIGITGFMRRPDGRGIALRFALWPEARGQGLAREAAAAALRFGHDRAGLARVVAIARETNFASRTVLGSIGMVHTETFAQSGLRMFLYTSEQR